MMYWKEWRRIRGRVLGLAGFFVITALFLPVPDLQDSSGYLFVPSFFIYWGGALLLVPAILGMDTYVGERDQGTEDFLFSKPFTSWTLLLSKIGLRLMGTIAVTLLVLLILTLRLQMTGGTLYLSTPPYVVWSILGTVFVAEMLVLLVTAATSVRAPYQSTALIIGGALGAVLASLPVVPVLWRTFLLQAIWSAFYIILVLTLLAGALAVSLLLNHQITGKRA